MGIYHNNLVYYVFVISKNSYRTIPLKNEDNWRCPLALLTGLFMPNVSSRTSSRSILSFYVIRYVMLYGILCYVYGFAFGFTGILS